MLMDNQKDLETEKDPQEIKILLQTHEHLKKLERAMAESVGTVIIR